MTLESFPASKQLASPIVQHNPQEVRDLIAASDLRLDADSPDFVTLSRWDQTLIGQRRAVADWFRLQLYGVLWAATGVDQFYPEEYDPPQRDLMDEQAFYGLEPPALKESDLAFDVLEAGVKLAGDVPVMLVNEPIYLSDGQNSDIRYNFYYPLLDLRPVPPGDQRVCRGERLAVPGRMGSGSVVVNLPTAPFTSPRRVKTCWLSRLPV